MPRHTQHCIGIDEIIQNVSNSNYPEKVKRRLLKYIEMELIKQRTGRGPKVAIPKPDEEDDECPPELYNNYGVYIYLAIYAGAACLFHEQLTELFTYVYELIATNQDVVNIPMGNELITTTQGVVLLKDIPPPSNEPSLLPNILGWPFFMHGFSAFMDRFAGFIANIAKSDNPDKYVPKFVRVILNMFCMLYKRRITLAEAKRKIAVELAEAKQKIADELADELAEARRIHHETMTQPQHRKRKEEDIVYINTGDRGSDGYGINPIRKTKKNKKTNKNKKKKKRVTRIRID
jgi:hypothetical protein